jgi:hypothetical protein
MLRSLSELGSFGPDYRADVDKDELVRTITSAHSDIAGLVEGISDDQLLQPVMDDWSAQRGPR